MGSVRVSSLPRPLPSPIIVPDRDARPGGVVAAFRPMSEVITRKSDVAVSVATGNLSEMSNVSPEGREGKNGERNGGPLRMRSLAAFSFCGPAGIAGGPAAESAETPLSAFAGHETRFLARARARALGFTTLITIDV